MQGHKFMDLLRTEREGERGRKFMDLLRIKPLINLWSLLLPGNGNNQTVLNHPGFNP
jgi:hypothetical protein